MKLRQRGEAEIDIFDPLAALACYFRGIEVGLEVGGNGFEALRII